LQEILKPNEADIEKIAIISDADTDFEAFRELSGFDARILVVGIPL